MSNLPVSTGAPVGQRFTVDQKETMGYPLVAIGNRLVKQVAETEDTRTISFDAVGWQIEQPKTDEARLPSALLYDAYFGFMFLYALAGYPEDGKITFSQYEFLQLIGWVSNGRSLTGKRQSKPSGRHYQQLKEACRTLMKTIYFRENQNRSQGFNVLSFYDLVGDQTGPRAIGKELPKRSTVQFSLPFVKMLQGGASAIRMDLDIYLSLSTGTSRVLFRLLSWMRAEGLETVSLETLFHRLGSVQKQYVPAYARKILKQPHEEMIARGILEKEPDYEKINGEWFVTYKFGNPATLLAEDEAVVQMAIGYGVKPQIARELVVAHRERFKEVLTAVAEGRLKADVNVAGLVVSYTRRSDYTIPSDTKPRVVGAPSQPPVAESDLEAEYRIWVANEQARLIRERKDLDLQAIRTEIIRNCISSGIASPDEWYVDGLVNQRLNRQLNIPPFEWYRQQRRSGQMEAPQPPIL